MRLHELKPRDSKVILFEKTYELKPFTLAAEVWAYSEFATKTEPNGLLTLSEKVANLDFEAVAKLCYFLIKDKSDFISEEDFLFRATSEDKPEHHYVNFTKMFKAVVESMGASQPDKEEIESELELKKLSAATWKMKLRRIGSQFLT